MGNKDNKFEKGGITRRSFLKYGGIAAASLAVACGGSGGSSGSSDSSGSDNGISYKVFSTDLLFIGGGFGAMSAGYEAVKNNKNITILDKGPFRASGGAGMNWDVQYVWYPTTDDNNGINIAGYKADSVLKFVTNKKAIQNADLTDPNRSALEFFGNRGELFPYREEDGSLEYDLNYPTIAMVPGGYPRHIQDELIKSTLVNVSDRTMVTSLLMEDGVCVGAVAVHLPTGEYRIYKADAVILAAGANCWLNGWNTVAANSMNSPDNTSDVEMAAYRLGARVGESEFGSYDLISIYPSGIAYSFNAGLGADANENQYILDADHVAFLQDAKYDQTRFLTDRPYFNQCVGEYMTDESKLTPNGGLYLDLSDPATLEEIRPCYSRSAQLWKDNFDIDVTNGAYVEIGFEMYEHGGAPVIDEKMMTDIPGLFCTRGAGINGERGGTAEYMNIRMGSYTLRSALEYIDGYSNNTSDYSSAIEEFERLEEIRKRSAKSGLRPHVVRQNIQKAVGPAFSVVRTTEKLEAASAELARIRAEDLPNQICADNSKTYNTEWRMAIENYNMIEIAEMAINATLMREESRGYYRPEYPDKDDENWGCMLAAKLVDGEMEFEKVFFDDISWDNVTWES